MIVAILPAHPLLMIGAGLTNSRVLHLGSAGLAVLLAYLLGGFASARFRRVHVALLACLLSLATLHNLAAWRWTSRLSQDLLSEVQQLEPTPAPNTQFVFYNLPDTIRGVFFFHEGLLEAVRMAYGRDDLSVTRILGSPPANSPPETGNPVVRLEWKGEAGPLLGRLPGRAAEN
jgi:hypothetical protein